MPSIYNSLPDILEASNTPLRLKAHLLSELSQLVVKYRLQSRTRIVLVHRHFTLGDNEQMVSLMGFHREISIVFTDGVPDPQIIAEYNVDFPQVPSLLPSKFLIRESELIPYEYSCGEQGNVKDWDITQVDKAFLAEWTQTLQRSGTETCFGLTLFENVASVLQLEHSFQHNRVSVTQPSLNVEFMDDFVPTVWSVSDDGEPSVCSGCRTCSYS